MHPLIQDAAAFASFAHGSIGQKRKYTEEPYIMHPAAVAAIAAVADLSNEAIAAAWLHDVVEDTPVSLSEIAERFGVKVAEYVDFLTDNTTPEDGNRASRKAITLARLAAAPREVKTIKLADLIHNVGTIVRHDPEFAQVYLPEKQALLEVLRGGDPILWQRARTLISEGLAAIDSSL